MTIVIKEKEAKNLRSGVNNHDWREERERGNVINYNFIKNLKLYIIKKMSTTSSTCILQEK